MKDGESPRGGSTRKSSIEAAHTRNNVQQPLWPGTTMVTKNSRSLFSQMALDDVFLLQDSTSRETNQHYTPAHSVFEHLSVVNGRAEKAVLLVQDLNKS